MSITRLYGRYFQKSKAFLYPLIVPAKDLDTAAWKTCIALEDTYSAADCRLLVYRRNTSGQRMVELECRYLMSCTFYEKHFAIDTKTVVYVFNLEQYREDWKHFLGGRYSRLSLALKQRIRSYFGPASNDWKYMESFLFPEKYFSLYSELLYDEEDRAHGLVMLKYVGELCDKPDLSAETLKALKEQVISYQGTERQRGLGE